MKFELEPKKFYAVGKWTFIAIAISSLLILLKNFNNLEGLEIARQAFFVVFYFAISASFAYLLNQMKKPIPTDMDLQDLISKLNSKEEVKNG